jgi:hypothetical protein
MWLAGILGENDDDDPLLIYSGDGGGTWKSVKKHDVRLEWVPKGWLEGQRRVGDVSR